MQNSDGTYCIATTLLQYSVPLDLLCYCCGDQYGRVTHNDPALRRFCLPLQIPLYPKSMREKSWHCSIIPAIAPAPSHRIVLQGSPNCDFFLHCPKSVASTHAPMGPMSPDAILRNESDLHCPSANLCTPSSLSL